MLLRHNLRKERQLSLRSCYPEVFEFRLQLKQSRKSTSLKGINSTNEDDKIRHQSHENHRLIFD